MRSIPAIFPVEFHHVHILLPKINTSDCKTTHSRHEEVKNQTQRNEDRFSKNFLSSRKKVGDNLYHVLHSIEQDYYRKGRERFILKKGHNLLFVWDSEWKYLKKTHLSIIMY